MVVYILYYIIVQFCHSESPFSGVQCHWQWRIILMYAIPPPFSLFGPVLDDIMCILQHLIQTFLWWIICSVFQKDSIYYSQVPLLGHKCDPKWSSGTRHYTMNITMCWRICHLGFGWPLWPIKAWMGLAQCMDCTNYQYKHHHGDPQRGDTFTLPNCPWVKV